MKGIREGLEVRPALLTLATMQGQCDSCSTPDIEVGCLPNTLSIPPGLAPQAYLETHGHHADQEKVADLLTQVGCLVHRAGTILPGLST